MVIDIRMDPTQRLVAFAGACILAGDLTPILVTLEAKGISFAILARDLAIAGLLIFSVLKPTRLSGPIALLVMVYLIARQSFTFGFSLGNNEPFSGGYAAMIAATALLIACIRKVMDPR